MQIRWRKSNSCRKKLETHLVNVGTNNRIHDGKDNIDIEIRETGSEDETWISNDSKSSSVSGEDP